MAREPRYLRSSTQIEPLYHQWYAWSHLVSPATAAMNVANGHLKILRSFLAGPEVHVAAVANPDLLGGPFVDHPPERAPEIAQLLERTLTEQAPLLAFAKGVKELDDLLAAEARGASLAALYARVPEALRGYVELTYDLAGAPGMRVLEPLLYRSPLHDPRFQSLSLSRSTGDHRAFALSTPRLPDAGTLGLHVPFAHPAVDRLVRSRTEGIGDVPELAAELGTTAELLEPFLGPEPERAPERWGGEGVRVRYFGHASVLLETRDASVLVDPTVSYPSAHAPERFDFRDLPPRIDYVLVTHNHQDHLLLETLLQIRHRVGTVVVPRGGSGALQDPSLKLMLHAIGFPRVVELDVLETLEIPGGSITGLPFLGEHADLDIATKLAHLVRFGAFAALFAADSDNVEPRLYDHVRAAVGKIPVVFLGMECEGAPLSWLYGPLLSRPLTRKMDQSRRLSGSDAKKAIAMLERLEPDDVFVYAMGQEPWLGYVMSVRYTATSRPIVESDALVAWCRERGIAAERLFARMEKVYPT